jgi:benzoyl-CoA reductase/2-hydroxyglutaryl-CoA dehydratase subunit BcrC/BadD/HgdB
LTEKRDFSSHYQEMFYILEVLEMFQEIKEKLKEADKSGIVIIILKFCLVFCSFFSLV